jgi:thymidine kinase
MSGSITLYLGSMKSFKTSELFKVLDNSKYRKVKSCLVRPKIDNRKFVSRYEDKLSINDNIIITNTIESISKNLLEYDVICIDEGQFIPDIGPMSHQLALSGKEIYIAALNGDAEMRSWESISELLPFVDNIKRFSGICDECKKKTTTFSYFTQRKSHQIEIGDGSYKILCRDCHNKLTKIRDEIECQS